MLQTIISIQYLLILISVINTTVLSTKPHIIHILADDLGWGELGYHNPEAGSDIKTPNIDHLVKEGLELDRLYAEKICSPSRCSLQTGRLGIHVNVQNVFPEVHNPNDTIGGYQGIPLNMTGIAEKLHDAGYTTRAIGKWDIGMATEAHSPWSRGYESWLGYWHHSNDYWTQDETSCNFHPIKDLWRHNATYSGPALDLQNGPSCTQDSQFPENEKCVFEEDILMDEVQRVIRSHDTSTPLFMFYSMHLVHMPLQIKEQLLEEFNFIDDKWRQLMHAMVYQVDINVGLIVDALKDSGLWDNALVVFHSDNGGEIMAQLCGGNNWPLRGGKFSNFEGGIRVNGFITGGYLPTERRGQRVEAIMSVADWYATYAHLAGLQEEDWEDTRAAAAGLPPIDSHNCWPVLMGVPGECREELPIGDTSSVKPNGDGDTLVGGLIRNGYKILVGAANKQYLVGQDVLTAPLWPNTSFPPLTPELHPRVCGRTVENGCLFNIMDDPQETHSLATEKPALFFDMLRRIDELQETVYSPIRGDKDPEACEQAIENGYYWGPWIKT